MNAVVAAIRSGFGSATVMLPRLLGLTQHLTSYLIVGTLTSGGDDQALG
jgi:hypothetical protein